MRVSGSAVENEVTVAVRMVSQKPRYPSIPPLAAWKLGVSMAKAAWGSVVTVAR